jgi:hypothetical protein
VVNICYSAKFCLVYVIEHHEQLDLALREMNNKLGEELEGLEVLLAAAHAKEVQKLQDTIQNQVWLNLYCYSSKSQSLCLLVNVC